MYHKRQTIEKIDFVLDLFLLNFAQNFLVVLTTERCETRWGDRNNGGLSPIVI